MQDNRTAIQSDENTANSLIKKWLHFIRDIESGYSYSIYEYSNELTIRDKIQRLEDSVLSDDMKNRIKQLDAFFINATNPTEIHLTESKGYDSFPWWWHRIPKKLQGELAEDVASIPNIH